MCLSSHREIIDRRQSITFVVAAFDSSWSSHYPLGSWLEVCLCLTGATLDLNKAGFQASV